MDNLVQRFIDVKTRISGNREKRAYEYTFGTVSYTHLMPVGAKALWNMNIW